MSRSSWAVTVKKSHILSAGQQACCLHPQCPGLIQSLDAAGRESAVREDFSARCSILDFLQSAHLCRAWSTSSLMPWLLSQQWRLVACHFLCVKPSTTELHPSPGLPLTSSVACQSSSSLEQALCLARMSVLPRGFSSPVPLSSDTVCED